MTKKRNNNKLSNRNIQWPSRNIQRLQKQTTENNHSWKTWIARKCNNDSKNLLQGVD